MNCIIPAPILGIIVLTLEDFTPFMYNSVVRKPWKEGLGAKHAAPSFSTSALIFVSQVQGTGCTFGGKRVTTQTLF